MKEGHLKTVRLSARLWAEVDAIARAEGVSAAEVMREAIIRHLERLSKPPQNDEQATRRSEPPVS